MDSVPQPEVAPAFGANPRNVFLLLLAFALAYYQLRPRKAPLPPAPVAPEVFTYYTPKELKKFNGVEDKRILMAIRGNVFDVSIGKQFYGPQGPYGNFAGRDASRGLAKGSFEEDMLTPMNEPIDKLEDLTEEEETALIDWEAHFKNKYQVVGALVEEGQKPTQKAGLTKE